MTGSLHVGVQSPLEGDTPSNKSVYSRVGVLRGNFGMSRTQRGHKGGTDGSSWEWDEEGSPGDVRTEERTAGTFGRRERSGVRSPSVNMSSFDPDWGGLGILAPTYMS